MHSGPLSLLALLGCDNPFGPGVLPDTLSAVVRLNDGRIASVLVELDRPGHQPTVRLTPGVLAIGPGWVRQVELDADAEGRVRVIVADPVTGERVEEVVDAHARIDSLLGGMAVVGDRRVGIPTPAGSPDPGRPEASMEGPGRGFRVQLDPEGTLRMGLPRAEDAQLQPIALGVAEVLGSWWVRVGDLSPAGRAAIDRAFKEVAVLGVEPGVATADGQLDDWDETQALAVSRPSQVLDGLAAWSGPRDASFAVAARRADGGGVVLVVRARDDDLVPGEDAIEIRSGDDRWTVALGSTRVEPTGWHVFGAPSVSFGWMVEVEVPTAGRAPEQLPWVVHLVDVDQGEVGPTRLGTAAWPSLIGVGPPGVARAGSLVAPVHQ